MNECFKVYSQHATVHLKPSDISSANRLDHCPNHLPTEPELNSSSSTPNDHVTEAEPTSLRLTLPLLAQFPTYQFVRM